MTTGIPLVRRMLPQLGAKPQSIQARHLEIGQDQVRLLRQGLFKSLDPITGNNDPRAPLDEIMSQDAHQAFLIIRDQYVRPGYFHWLRHPSYRRKTDG